MEVTDVDLPGFFGFKIDSVVGRPFVMKAIGVIPGVNIIKRGTTRFAVLLAGFYALEELICEFEIEGETFCAFEPFGDSDAYLIGQEHREAKSLHLTRIKEHFAALELPGPPSTFLQRILGVLERLLHNSSARKVDDGGC